jgi:hypothetical protein
VLFSAFGLHLHYIDFIRLRQNTLRLAAGMNGKVNAPKLFRAKAGWLWRIPLDTPPLAVGSFIVKKY